MAAALATIEVLETTDTLPRIWALGERLVAGLRGAVQRTGAQAEVVGLAPMPFVRFVDPAPDRARRDQRVFFTEVIRNGILLHPNHHWYLCGAMTEADVDTTIAVAERAFGLLGEG
jgi:glutamate-1-semialdehyde 2,1-aminomutase